MGRQERGYKARGREDVDASLDMWKPKTDLGMKVKKGEITDILQILNNNWKIKEPEIVDKLVPNLGVDFMLIGQRKGKFGGGQRSLIRNTQKKTAEGNKPNFSAMAIVGNRDGILGVGIGSAKEGIPAREKAIRRAKLNIFLVIRGCGSWKCDCGMPHSLPFKVHGKCASVEVKMMPAPKGTGLVCDKELKKVLGLAGYADIWFKTTGKTSTKINFTNACVHALEKASRMRVLSGETRVRYGPVRT